METEFRLYQETDYPDLRDMIFSLYREDPEGESINEEKIRLLPNSGKIRAN